MDSAHVPNDAVTRPGPNPPGLGENTIGTGGFYLMTGIPLLAKEFGATKVHIVAHSKGGLWSRAFPPPPIERED